MDQIELQILAYLSSNPEAEDTVRGITEWWLLKRRIRSGAAAVEGALAALVSRGLVAQRAGPDGCARYQVSAQSSAGVKHLLERHVGGTIGKRGAGARRRRLGRPERGRKAVGGARRGKRA
jgi:hypothetical protein